MTSFAKASMEFGKSNFSSISSLYLHCLWIYFVFLYLGFQFRKSCFICFRTWLKEYLTLEIPIFCSSKHVHPNIEHLVKNLEEFSWPLKFSSVQFSRSVMSDSLRPHESQHARPPCPSPTRGVHSNSCSSSRWCHPAISSSVVPFSSCPQSLPASVFSNESALRMRWQKYWSFSFSIIPSKEHS